jgi:hypothetical protein
MTVTMTMSDTIGIATEIDSKTTCQCSESNMGYSHRFGSAKDPTVPGGAVRPGRGLGLPLRKPASNKFEA